MAKVFIKSELTNKTSVFQDRFEAGFVLSEMLRPSYEKARNTLVLAIPAGGVPIGVVVSKELDLPIDIILVRKIHFPDNPEAGFGALSFDGEIILNEELVSYAGLTQELIEQQIEKEKKDLEERERLFRQGRPFPDLSGQKVIVVDDGLASGYTMLAAVKSIARHKAQKIIVAVPTASDRAISKISPLVDEIFCPNVRTGRYFAVADAYRRWYDLSREEVLFLLKEAKITS